MMDILEFVTKDREVSDLCYARDEAERTTCNQVTCTFHTQDRQNSRRAFYEVHFIYNAPSQSNERVDDIKVMVDVHSEREPVFRIDFVETY